MKLVFYINNAKYVLKNLGWKTKICKLNVNKLHCKCKKNVKIKLNRGQKRAEVATDLQMKIRISGNKKENPRVG